MILSDYATLVFDCDGVVLDSNRIKTQAFRIAAQAYGTAEAEALVEHHVANGGISRYCKFAYFLDRIVPGFAPGQKEPGILCLLQAYAAEVRGRLMECAVTDRLEDLRAATSSARWLIVSGGDQAELREIFSARALDFLFDGGIFGSPDDKATILHREIARENIRQPALFLGDSRADHEAAFENQLGFVFVSGWTEMSDWQTYCSVNQLETIARAGCLLNKPAMVIADTGSFAR